MNELLLGIDVGSTTVKAVLVDAATGEARHGAYRRHRAEQLRTVRDLLAEVRDVADGAPLRVGVCGSGGGPVASRLGAPLIQEVVANAVAVQTLHPDARTAIELGGQDAKIVFFERDPVTRRTIASDMRMNGVCAGGTGAFLDEIAALLETPIEAFDALAAGGAASHHISGRCGVFAKTDLQPLLNQGVSKADLARSTLAAVVRQTIGGLAQGTTLRAPVVFEGGPLTFIPTLVREFAEALGLDDADAILPARPELVVAYGCARALSDLPEEASRTCTASDLIVALGARASAARDRTDDDAAPFFESDAERVSFERRHALPPPVDDLPGGPGRFEAFLGIDAGSTTSKLALIDTKGRVRYAFYGSNRGRPLEVLRGALLDLYATCEERGIRLHLRGAGTTGYGERLAAAAFHADHRAVETVAHARAALHYRPDADFVLDIGGQDMKAIFLDRGVVTSITLNEACSSGCGAFLETFAADLGVPVEAIAESAFASRVPARLGSRCTVFMRSSVITEQRAGKSPEDILAGLCRSVVLNVFTKVLRIASSAELGERVVVQGGTFRNDAVVRALEQYLGREVTRAPYPELMGAIGVALLTRERLERSDARSEAPSQLLGPDALRAFAYAERTGESCPFCSNRCDRTVVTFADGGTYVHGNRCERGEIVGDPRDAAVRDRVRAAGRRIRSVPDLMTERQQLLRKRWSEPPADGPPRGVVGIPMALDAWRRLPFWRAVHEHVGVEVRLSGPSSHALYATGLASIPSDTVCFPAKLAHGHVAALEAAGVDRIFVPIVITAPADHPQVELDRPCAVLHGYGAVLRENRAEGATVPIDAPTFVWNTPAMRRDQLADYLERTYGVARSEARAAVASGVEAQERYRAALERRGADVLEQLAESGGFAAVVAARSYQGDPLVNHDVAAHFVRLGVPVLPTEALPGLDREPIDVRVPPHSAVQARLFAAATRVARDPRLELVQLTSFGCGHDAVLHGELDRIVAAGGKQLLQLKLDESHVRGPMRLRVTSFVETVRQRRRAGRAPEPAPRHPLPIFDRSDRAQRTVWVPNLSPGFSRLAASVANARGFAMAPLPLADAAALELGKRHLHPDICFPAQVNVGEFLRQLERTGADPDAVAFGIHQNCDGCRAGQYAALARAALDRAGLEQVPIVTTHPSGSDLHPGFRLDERMRLRLVWGVTLLDALEAMRRSTRPYERTPGDAERAFDAALEDLCRHAPHDTSRALRSLRDAVRAFNRIPVADVGDRPTVMVLGEVLVAIHPSANYRIEAYLERRGAEVLGARLAPFFQQSFVRARAERTLFGARPGIGARLAEGVGNAMFRRAHATVERILEGYRRYRPSPAAEAIQEAAHDLLAPVHDCGEGWLLPGEILHGAAHGIQNFVVVQPFGCMPNHVVGRGMFRAIKRRHPRVQLLSLDVDPDTSLGNLENRLHMVAMNARARHDARIAEA